MITILIIILILVALGGLPRGEQPIHPYGYYPSGIATIIVIILLILLLQGRSLHL